MPNPFDFFDTSLDIKPNNLSLADADYGLMPKVPAGDTTDKGIALSDSVFDQINKIEDNLPAYGYTKKEADRYSNPYLQYTPKVNQAGQDIEDIYGSRQSSLKQLGNALVKTGANLVGTFGSHYLSMPHTLDLVRSGKAIEAFEDDSMFAGVQEWLEGMENKFPNYYTEWERKHPYLSALSPVGFANFWGDKVLKNVGFSIGGLAAGLVDDAALELLTGGTFTPAATLAAASQFKKAYSNMMRGFKSLNKVAYAGKVDDVLNGVKYADDFMSGLTSVATLNKIKHGTKLAAIGYLGAQGEAFIEGYHNFVDTKTDAAKKAYEQGVLNAEEYEKILKNANDSARWTTGLNLPLLTLSNMIQFPTLLGGRVFESVPKSFIKSTLTEEGLNIVNNWTLKKGTWEFAKESIKDFASEGYEEGAQYFIGNSLHDYYSDKANVEAKKGLLDFVLENSPKYLKDEQMWQEAFLGGLSGFLMGLPTKKTASYFSKSGVDSIVNNLNETYQNFSKVHKEFVFNGQMVNASPTDKQEIAHKSLFSTVHAMLNKGLFDMHMDNLNDLGDLTTEEFNKTFGTDFTKDQEKDVYVKNLRNESEAIKKDIIDINQRYLTNPYTKSAAIKKIQQAFGTDRVDSVQEALFEEFKEAASFNQARLRRVGNKLSDKIFNLQQLGVSEESVPYLLNLAHTEKGLTSYLKYKKEQSKALDNTIDYLEQIVKTGKETNQDVRESQQQLIAAKFKKERLESLYQTVIDSIGDKKFKDMSDDEKSAIQTKILQEEVPFDVFTKYKESIDQQVKDAQKDKNELDNLEAEQGDMLSEDSKTQDKIIDIVADAQDQSQPFDNEADPAKSKKSTPTPPPTTVVTPDGQTVQLDEEGLPVDTPQSQPVQENPQTTVESTEDLEGQKGIGMIDESIPMYYDFRDYETGDISKDKIAYKYLKDQGIDVDWLQGKVLTHKETGRFAFNYDGRLFILVKVGKSIVPFYYSSKGTSGKSIDWHTVFGIDTNYDWIIKGSVDENGNMKLPGKVMNYVYEDQIKTLNNALKEFREKINITPDQRSNIIDRIVSDAQSQPGGKFYSKDIVPISNAFKNFYVAKGYNYDEGGMEVDNDLFNKIVQFVLFQISPISTEEWQRRNKEAIAKFSNKENEEPSTIIQEPITTESNEKEENQPMLEGVQSTGNEEKEREESTQLRTQEESIKPGISYQDVIQEIIDLRGKDIADAVKYRLDPVYAQKDSKEKIDDYGRLEELYPGKFPLLTKFIEQETDRIWGVLNKSKTEKEIQQPEDFDEYQQDTIKDTLSYDFTYEEVLSNPDAFFIRKGKPNKLYQVKKVNGKPTGELVSFEYSKKKGIKIGAPKKVNQSVVSNYTYQQVIFEDADKNVLEALPKSMQTTPIAEVEDIMEKEIKQSIDTFMSQGGSKIFSPDVLYLHIKNGNIELKC